MKVVTAFPGARGVDSLPFSQGGTEAQAKRLAASGIDFFVGYLGAMNKTRLGYILDAGLAFMPVTFAGAYENGGADEVAQLKALGIPAGCSVWLDLEGQKAWNTPADQLMPKLEGWAATVASGGWMPCLYVGAPQPLTGRQLYNLKGIVRYWLGIGRCIGRDLKDAYPDCGWCMRQDWHGQKNGMLWPPVSHFPNVPANERVFVDTNAIQCDHKGRLPAWVVK